MAVTETTTEGWFSRLGGAIKGVFGGIALIIIAIIMLGWNEKRSVDRYNTIDYAKIAMYFFQVFFCAFCLKFSHLS